MYRSYLPDQEAFFSPGSSQSAPFSSPKEQPHRDGKPPSQKGILSQLMERLFGAGQSGGLSSLLNGGGLGQLDKGDLLLFLILLFLYWESEDDEWLIILGLLFLFG